MYAEDGLIYFLRKLRFCMSTAAVIINWNWSNGIAASNVIRNHCFPIFLIT
jgi:hypothetical protein